LLARQASPSYVKVQVIMTEEITLAQLAREIAELRRQVETVNQRLDMIYGAVTRLAEQGAPRPTTPARPELSVAAMMDPGSMLDALHQFAVQAGLDVSKETVERLKYNPAAGEAEEPSHE
jgi:hypothetical protein